MKYFLIVMAIIIASGCGVLTGNINYQSPDYDYKYNNSIVIDKEIDDVWMRFVPEIGKSFFVVNNIDKISGFINVSYSGDPEKYVDCGTITSYVKNLKGERNYVFPGAKSFQQYEYVYNNNLYFSARKMVLEGRANIIFEQLNSSKTKVTANTKYIITRTVNVTNVMGQSATPLIETINFNTGEISYFTLGANKLKCRPNGKFEADILLLVK